LSATPEMIRRAWSAVFLLVSAGCASAPPRSGGAADRVLLDVPFVKQEAWYCGGAAVSACVRYYGGFVSQHEVARELFSKKRGGILNVHLAMFLRERGYWTKTLVLTDYATRKERERKLRSLVSRLKNFLRMKHPVIVLLGPPSGDILGFKVRIFLGPLFYMSDYEDVVMLNHYVVLTGYDDARGVFYLHDGLRPNVPVPYARFTRRWRAVGCWALVAVPPRALDWKLTPEELLDAGYVCERTERYREAASYYRAALDGLPRVKDSRARAGLRRRLMFNMANVYLALGEYRDAETLLKNLLEEEGESAPVLNNLAVVYLKMKKNLAEAEKMAARALSIDRKNAVYYADTAAMLLLEKGEGKRALDVLLRLVPSAHSDEILSVLYFHLGVAYERAGKFGKAYEYFGKAAARVNEENEPRRASRYALRRALCGLKLGRRREARGDFDKVMALDRGGRYAARAREEWLKLMHERVFR